MRDNNDYNNNSLSPDSNVINSSFTNSKNINNRNDMTHSKDSYSNSNNNNPEETFGLTNSKVKLEKEDVLSKSIEMKSILPNISLNITSTRAFEIPEKNKNIINYEEEKKTEFDDILKNYHRRLSNASKLEDKEYEGFLNKLYSNTQKYFDNKLKSVMRKQRFTSNQLKNLRKKEEESEIKFYKKIIKVNSNIK